MSYIIIYGIINLIGDKKLTHSLVRRLSIFRNIISIIFMILRILFALWSINQSINQSFNQSINQSMHFKERFKLYNLQIYINNFYFTWYTCDNRDNEDFWIGYLKVNKIKAAAELQQFLLWFELLKFPLYSKAKPRTGNSL